MNPYHQRSSQKSHTTVQNNGGKIDISWASNYNQIVHFFRISSS